MLDPKLLEKYKKIDEERGGLPHPAGYYMNILFKKEPKYQRMFLKAMFQDDYLREDFKKTYIQAKGKLDSIRFRVNNDDENLIDFCVDIDEFLDIINSID